MNFEPLNIKISKTVMNGQMYELVDYNDYGKQSELYSNSQEPIAFKEKVDGKDIVLPFKGDYSGKPINPGVYNAGPIDFIIYPDEDNIDKYIPEEIIEFNNMSKMQDILERQKTLVKLREPWITTPDNITKLPINNDDNPEMVCLKTAINEKEIDLDKYSVRFGDNFPNDKRQLKNSGATLNIIKRFCDKCDMEALLTLRDKNPDVPNPIGREITVSLTEIENEEECDE